MNPAQLLAHFDRISDAPDAIPRLRRFILDLAVRGKLVEQDPRDEPAPELLRDIYAKREKYRKSAKASTHGPTPNIDKIPFPLGRGWVWTQLGELANLENGDRSKNYPSRDEFVTDGIPFINAGHLDNGEVRFNSMNYIPEQRFDLLKSGKVQPGDILFCLRGSLGKAALVKGISRGAIASSLVIIRLAGNISAQFLLRYLLSSLAYEMIKRFDNGTAQPNLSSADLGKFLFPLPPLAEQHRIVAKVDELMALCDRLEAAQTERESRRDRLMAASLNRLNNGAEADAFHDHARFYFNHLPRLATKPEHIQQLRQTILNLAVRGKLVPQDPKDEPASELLKRINAEQEELIKTRVLKPNCKNSQSLEEDLAFDLPQTWQWVPLSSIIIFGPQNGLSPKPSSRPDAPRAITLTATTSGQFNPQHFKRVEANIPPDSEFWLRSGDLLFQRGNTREYVGIAAYYTGEPRLFLYPDLMMKVRISQKASLRYIHLWALAPPARTYFSTHATGAQATMPKINQGTLLQLPVPIPPLAEQQRIVAKVDELMALCDRLETQLTTTHTDSRRLLEAVLHDALATAGQQ